MQYQCLTFSHLSWSRTLMNIPANASKLLYIVPVEQFWENCPIGKVTTESYWKTFTKLKIFWLGAQVVLNIGGSCFKEKTAKNAGKKFQSFWRRSSSNYIYFVKNILHLTVTFCESEIKFSFMRRFRDLLWGSMKMKRLTACNTKNMIMTMFVLWNVLAITSTHDLKQKMTVLMESWIFQ